VTLDPFPLFDARSMLIKTLFQEDVKVNLWKVAQSPWVEVLNAMRMAPKRRKIIRWRIKILV
jgi:hypothetical protein